MDGRLEPGDVAALRRFICLTQEQFAEALGISVHTLRNWEQDRVTPDGPGLALLRIAARHPRAASPRSSRELELSRVEVVLVPAGRTVITERSG
jgi:transcriptional regulator with XRE-family HTH domain